MTHNATAGGARTTGAPSAHRPDGAPAPRLGPGTPRTMARGPRLPRGLRLVLELALFIGPALVLFLFFVVWPIVKALQFSVYRWKGFGPLVDFVGLSNYVSVLQNDVFTSALGHNLVIVVLSILIQLPLGLGIALLLNRRLKGQGLLRTVIFVPYVLAEVIAGVIWLQLLQPQYGVVDGLLGAVGLSGPEQGWLGTPELALYAVFVVLTWKYLGLAVILFLAGLQSVPTELYEAAQIDGASWWQVQRSITVPMLGPTLRTWAFLSMIGSLQVFDMVWILTGGGPADSTTTMATFLINEGTKRHNFGIASAASVVLFVVALVMALLYQYLVLRRDTEDSDKPRRAG